MRIAVLGDSVLPVPTQGGHGLGRVTHIVASELLARGHDVVLFARPGSTFSGNLVMPPDADGHADYRGEQALAREAYRLHCDWPFDCFIDNGHLHILARYFPDLPVIDVFHDQYQAYARCAVLLSEGQRALMPPEFEQARIIRNALPVAEFEPSYAPADPPYLLWMGALAGFKRPMLAIEAAARYGVKLVMAGAQMVGQLPWDDNGNVEYVGIQAGRRRDDLMRGARVFLQLGAGESFGLTTLEAGLFGTPVVGYPAGGTLDLVQYGLNGALVPTTGGDSVQNVCDAIDRAWYMDRALCRQVAELISDVSGQVDAYENACEACAAGENW